MDTMEMYGLRGKKAIACGSSQGIGRACAVQFAKLGAEVTLIARDEQALRSVCSELDTEAGQKHRYVSADFTKPDDLQGKVEQLVKQVGPVQILLNNTGGPPHGPIVDAAPRAFLDALTMHVVCNQILLQTVLAGMKASGYGRVINIISISVKEPINGLGVSNTTRGAVASWSKTMANELGGFGITVNNILPGYTATGRLDELANAKAKAMGVSADDIRNEWVSQVPLGRLGNPEEIAAAAGFLASPAASYVNGINLTVDGGRTSSL
jgi:3-oxoacyl-[acyl-carrier protein] reductase